MSISIPRAWVIVELASGALFAVRVILADRIATERTARAGGWDLQEQQHRALGVLAYHAAKRAGRFDGSLDDFLQQVVDVRDTATDPEHDDDREGDADTPTQTAPGTEPQ